LQIGIVDVFDDAPAFCTLLINIGQFL